LWWDSCLIGLEFHSLFSRYCSRFLRILSLIVPSFFGRATRSLITLYF
jgi:hypothetical protein